MSDASFSSVDLIVLFLCRFCRMAPAWLDAGGGAGSHIREFCGRRKLRGEARSGERGEGAPSTHACPTHGSGAFRGALFAGA